MPSFIAGAAFFAMLLSSLFIACSDAGEGKGSATTPATYDVESLLAWRRAKDDALRRRDDSPIPAQERAVFPGLRYFPPDTAYVFDVELERITPPEEVELGTTTGEQRPMKRIGRVRFALEGKSQALTVYEPMEGGELFLPFRDATSGGETYEIGRYVELQPRDSAGAYRLDFNYSYNPYCAYAPEYSCPRVPKENALAVAIRAGERLPAGGEN